MPTTIQISEVTRQRLALRRGKSKKSYDKVIQEMLETSTNSPDSLAGAFPKLKWTKKDRMKFEDE